MVFLYFLYSCTLPAGRACRAGIAHFDGDRAAAISYTFDDNLRDQYAVAVPMLNEVGFKGTFFVIPVSTAAEFTSWVGTCPGKQESAEENSSSRSAKGNKYMRRMLNQAAHAAARGKGTHFQAVKRGGRHPYFGDDLLS